MLQCSSAGEAPAYNRLILVFSYNATLCNLPPTQSPTNRDIKQNYLICVIEREEEEIAWKISDTEKEIETERFLPYCTQRFLVSLTAT